ncbi:diacylglycerol O-acyltransferase/trehalose O-mycolyltransferase [Dietzia sp. 2505]|uniref:alpha/beta hydrolase n=1 Tax=Dietzia sp. 2505 TaxID=3156457 RepID=UPI00339155EA
MTRRPDIDRDGRRTEGHGGARRRTRVALRSTAVSVAALLIGAGAGAGTAGAQSLDPGSLVPSVAPGSLFGVPSLSVAALTQLGAPIPLTSVLGSVAAAGSGDFPRPGSSQPPSGPVSTRDGSITQTTVRSIAPLFPGSLNPVDRRAEVWTVTSASMQRTVRVEVYRAPDGVDAPNVYFLDGVGSESPSGWSTGMGWGDPALRDRAVNVIAPTGAPASMWSDWQADDPVLGPNMWETFLIDELPPLLEQGLTGSAAPLAHNGSWGVMGLSMGASAAVHLANTNPGMFDAVAGISGAYSTTDELGYQYARLTVAARNGDATNMWGPRGSQAWRDHDTVADPSGLAGKTVYLSAATGRVGSAELGHFGSNEMILVDGHVLEKGSYESTRKLESTLADVAGVDLRMNYMPTGIHNWPVFVTQMQPGMDHILSGLAPAVPSLRAAAGGVDPGSAGSGSLGSAGSLGSTGSAGSRGN